jgi:murein DD-endopeptidase MepM/ murein hydrolase activator NlpD
VTLRRAAAVALVVAAVAAPPAQAGGDASVAALQVALRAKRIYAGPVDGVAGPATADAIRAFQRRARLAVDGIVGPRTRNALGRHGRPLLGRRLVHRRMVGWDVAAVQFLLAWHGFPSGAFDGVLGDRTDRALRRFQRWAGLAADGRVGPATIAALRAPPPVSPLRLMPPVAGSATDRFGPRGVRFHTGWDYPAPSGAPVAAAGSGRVTWAGWVDGGYGLLVVVAHSSGVRTLYAHLSRISVGVGQRVAAGQEVGLVGSTGHSTGPHLHFEVRVRGACVDPGTALGQV